MIDDMMVVLRKEEAEDIAQRDRCENGENANKNELEDLENSIEKTKDKIDRLGNSKKEVLGELDAVKEAIKDTKGEMEELLKFRNEESDAFKKALKDDSDAIELLTAANKALMKFYENNGKFLQEAPEYKEDPDKAP